MIISATAFSYVVASVFFLTENNTTGGQAVVRIEEMAEYLKNKKTPTSILFPITEFLRVKLFQKNSFYDEELILSRLPERIRKKILLIQNEEILSLLPIFKYMTNSSQKLYILSLMKTRVSIDNEIVVREGKTLSFFISHLYFISNFCLTSRFEFSFILFYFSGF